MQVQINTDRHIARNDELANQVEAVLEGSLSRFGERVTRVEVHLSDENSHKGGADDKRCVMEARLAGLTPIAVTHQAANLQQAIDGAARKLERAVDNTIGKQTSHKGRTSAGGAETI